ncbi:P-type DNA transfer protein VirB5 [Burkholderia multivorans]|uniref:P-type DNA transfer protein VirB5 n=1 Tax=Burkholderia multivorans TaxID=87883 RepID=UPI000CFEDB7C|nr:P-type DNA transfer protein VirB5 [Burkholderia multivorans]MCL4626066.1 P-type DNA transfer protein VirB5 [Burkholderia multivorans]PRG84616.1 P-type DNA transfer protein VirB5 [Burkholderia multivorans]
MKPIFNACQPARWPIGRSITALCTVVLVAGIPPAARAQGIPVFDASAVAQMLLTVSNLQQQVQQLMTTYNSLTGVRGFGSLLSNPVVAQSLPTNWQSIYTAIQQGGYSGLTGAAQALRSASEIYDCQNQSGVDQQICQRTLNKPFQDKALAQQAYQTELNELNQVQSLVQQIDQTQDPKGIAELQGRIAGEQAAIQQETTKLQLFRMMAETEDRLVTEQQHELDLQRSSSAQRAQDRLAPVKFN